MGALSCERLADLLGDYVEGVLSHDARPAVDEHLGVCPSCRALAADYQRLPEQLRRATDVQMPELGRARLRRLLSLVWRRH